MTELQGKHMKEQRLHRNGSKQKPAGWKQQNCKKEYIDGLRQTQKCRRRPVYEHGGDDIKLQIFGLPKLQEN